MRYTFRWRHLLFHICTHYIYYSLTSYNCRTIAQAISRRLPTAAARVRSKFRSYGIYGWQSGTGASVLWVLRCPLPIFIPPISKQSPSSIICAWYNRPVVAAVPSGHSLIPLRINRNGLQCVQYLPTSTVSEHTILLNDPCFKSICSEHSWVLC
jgi:hypothetical protein